MREVKKIRNNVIDKAITSKNIQRFYIPRVNYTLLIQVTVSIMLATL